MSLFQGATVIDGVYVGQASTAFTPVSVAIETVGAWTHPIPVGADRFDVVMFGGGAGGQDSGGTAGRGGGAGAAVTKTYTLNLDHIATGNVAGSNGAGGQTQGGGGGASTLTSGSTVLTAAGGAWSASSNFTGVDAQNVAFNGTVYPGGKGGTVAQMPGLQPGGGGAGGVTRGDPGGRGGNGATYLRFYAGAANAFLAQAVYLGAEKVWPIFVPRLSQWYAPGNATGGNTSSIDVPWPQGAEFCDVIMIGGGAGGVGSAAFANARLGGGAGEWGGRTYPRVDGSLTYTSLLLSVAAAAGTDGVGGSAFTPAAADGSNMRVTPKTATTTGPFFNAGGGFDLTSTTGNRNGGTPAASFTFNGRTYTLASFGAGAGQGGNSSNKNGSNGARPGGGGQSADAGGATGNAGGDGAHGAAILYWY